MFDLIALIVLTVTSLLMGGWMYLAIVDPDALFRGNKR